MIEERKKKLQAKKAFILALIYLLFNMYAHINASVTRDRNFSYEINYNKTRSSDEPYARYKNYNIYIGSEKYVCKYLSNQDNICIIDGRNCDNPNMKIYDSFKITNSDDMFNILAVLLDYERQNPSNWDRSLEGLQIEWVAHNISYQCGILPVNSGSVDLDNRDAILYEDKVIKLIFGK